MFAVSLSIGFSGLLSCVFLYRWVDLRTVRSLSLFILTVDAFIAGGLGYFSFLTSSSLFVPLSMSWGFAQTPMCIVFGFDAMSAFFFFILLVALILCLVFLGEYFEYDVSATEICTLSSLFSQLAFIFFCSRDLISLIFVWEWISIVSFFLIRFWSFRVATMKAALKVFVISQLGDILFLFGAITVVSVCGNSDISFLSANAATLLFTSISLMGIFINSLSILAVSLLLALFLKSAQVVFYPWLLDAMEAPVPISAQLHSSTLVIIGFYVFLRFFPLISSVGWVYSILLVVGFMTSTGASILGFFQNDGKRLLACSTAGQLGYVVMALGLGLTDEAALLLFFCCCNKAYTFVWLGCLMERTGGISDFRAMSKSGINIVERAGLVSAVLNSTFAPGAFAWHVKSLFSMGFLINDGILCTVCVETISITWFLSSLYLLRLLLACFATGGLGLSGSGFSVLSKRQSGLLLFTLQVLTLCSLGSFMLMGFFWISSFGLFGLVPAISIRL